MSRAVGAPLYRALDASLLRASAHLADVVPPGWPDIHDNDQVEACRAWLNAVWARQTVRDAVAVASPVLADRVGAFCAGSRPDVDRVRRLMLSTARYLIRMRGRATPFGLFASVAPLRFTDRVWVREGTDRAHVRADPGWLAATIARLEATPQVRRKLTVVLNDLTVVRGDRLVLAWRSEGSASEVSVRLTPAVRIVVETTRSPCRVRDLAARLVAEFPGTTEDVIEDAIAELVGCGVLITCLRPPSVVVDKPGHVLLALRETRADAGPEVALAMVELRAAQHRVPQDGLQSGSAGRTGGAPLNGPTFTVDLVSGCSVTLPTSVAREAAATADALARLSPDPTGHPGWREYHARFLDRYGSGGVVPLAQLLDPTTGLAFPRHFDRSTTANPSRCTTDRDERLLALAQQSALEGVREVELDAALLDSLAPPMPGRVAAHIDLCVDVRARSAADLEGGHFTLAVTGIGRTGVATSGRFLDLLDDDPAHRMAASFGRLPTEVEGALALQLSFPPHHARVDHVAQVRPLLHDVLPVGEHPADLQTRVTDIAVIADHRRMYLVSLSRRQVVEPLLASALARHAMPPVVRFLAELPRATTATVTLFDWGAADCLPFRPRLRHGRSILSAARWRLDPADLPRRSESPTTWNTEMARMRERLGLPADVWVGTGDRRLRLHLDEPMDADVLRAHLDRATGPVTIAEAPTAADHGWIGGRAHEIVVPMVSIASPAPAPAALTSGRELIVIGPAHGQLPGSSVLSARIDCHPTVIDAILTRHLPELLARWKAAPRWWFLRLRTPAPHLVLRLRVDDYGQAASHVGTWVADLRHTGMCGDLLLDTYRPEVARFGGDPATMAQAEAVFVADSAAVQLQLDVLQRRRQWNPQALTAASMVDLAAAMCGSAAAGSAWLVRRVDLAAGARRTERAMHRQALAIATDICDEHALAAAWSARREVVSRYVAALSIPVPDSVLLSLLHLHHVRAHGVDPDCEGTCHRLARAVALTRTARDRATAVTA